MLPIPPLFTSQAVAQWKTFGESLQISLFLPCPSLFQHRISITEGEDEDEEDESEDKEGEENDDHPTLDTTW